MKEFKGTKGEWGVNDKFREPEVLNESGKVIFTHNKSCCDTDVNTIVYYSHNKMMANAKLIAAAPDLLKELQKVRLDIKLSGVFREDSPIVKGIDEAINKALD
jgi:Ribonuclease G/E